MTKKIILLLLGLVILTNCSEVKTCFLTLNLSKNGIDSNEIRQQKIFFIPINTASNCEELLTKTSEQLEGISTTYSNFAISDQFIDGKNLKKLKDPQYYVVALGMDDKCNINWEACEEINLIQQCSDGITLEFTKKEEPALCNGLCNSDWECYFKTCDGNDECINTNPCDGVEFCGEENICQSGDSPVNGTECDVDNNQQTRDICLNKICVQSVCNDGYIDSDNGEECDPPSENICDSNCKLISQIDASTDLFDINNDLTEDNTSDLNNNDILDVSFDDNQQEDLYIDTGFDNYINDNNNLDFNIDGCLDSDGDQYGAGTCPNGTDCNDNSVFCNTNCSNNDCNKITWVNTGVYHTCAINNLGDLFCWGSNSSGQLGLGNNDILDHNRPEQIKTLSNVYKSAGGQYHTCSNTSSNELYCWGSNGSGQCGFGATNYSYSPKLVNTSNINFISSGLEHTCSINTSGQLFCWGKNSTGQLGIGNIVNQNTPQQITAIDNIKMVSEGSNFTCAITNDGALYCWGANSLGQLGLGNTDNSLTPQQVNLTNVSYVATGYDHACAVTEGDLYCWGANSKGELGLGSTSYDPYTTPQKLNISNINSVSVGYYHSCATDTSNKLYCWGDNTDGQLGFGNYQAKTSPQELNLDDIVFVVSNYYQNCAINTNSELYCWGSNNSGQLGVGDKNDRTSPSRVY